MTPRDHDTQDTLDLFERAEHFEWLAHREREDAEGGVSYDAQIVAALFLACALLERIARSLEARP